jgi:exopolysaccharide biosynthesis WecB/TagA/CpsF family protein
MKRPGSTIEILGVPVMRLAVSECVAEVERLYREEAPALVTYVNAHSLNQACRDAEYARLLRERFVVFKDGIGVGIGARMLGQRFPKNITFTDFSPLILRLAAEKGWRVFFVGSGPGVTETAAQRLCAQIPGLCVVGTLDGFSVWKAEAESLATIRAARPDVIIAGMGNPAQEKWLARNIGETGAQLGVGVGGFFDFSASVRVRAPEWMTRAGVEWIFRLVQEPGRLWRRYVIGNPEFLGRVALSRLRGSGARVRRSSGAQCSR